MALRRNNDFHTTVRAVKYSSFSYGGAAGAPVALTTGTSLKISSTEAGGHMVAYGTVYYIEV